MLDMLSLEKTSQKLHKNFPVNFPEVREDSIKSSKRYG